MDLNLTFCNAINANSCSLYKLEDGSYKFLKPKPSMGLWRQEKRETMTKFWKGLSREKFDYWVGYFMNQIEKDGVPGCIHYGKMLGTMQYWCWTVHGVFVPSPAWHLKKDFPSDLHSAVSQWLNKIIEVKHRWYKAMYSYEAQFPEVVLPSEPVTLIEYRENLNLSVIEADA